MCCHCVELIQYLCLISMGQTGINLMLGLLNCRAIKSSILISSISNFVWLSSLKAMKIAVQFWHASIVSNWNFSLMKSVGPHVNCSCVYDVCTSPIWVEVINLKNNWSDWLGGLFFPPHMSNGNGFVWKAFTWAENVFASTFKKLFKSQ